MDRKTFDEMAGQLAVAIESLAAMETAKTAADNTLAGLKKEIEQLKLAHQQELEQVKSARTLPDLSRQIDSALDAMESRGLLSHPKMARNQLRKDMLADPGLPLIILEKVANIIQPELRPQGQPSDMRHPSTTEEYDKWY